MFEFCPQATNCRSRHSRESASQTVSSLCVGLCRVTNTPTWLKRPTTAWLTFLLSAGQTFLLGWKWELAPLKAVDLKVICPLCLNELREDCVSKKDLNGLWGGGRKILSLRCTIYNLFCLAAENQLKLYEGAWWGFLILLHLESFWLSNLQSSTTWSDEWSFIILD